jgi:glycosyltransferase involved in cell wall biosynthesis
MAVRDGAATLETCLASLEAQTLRDWEAVVVDDGSQDETGRILAAWARRDPRIRPVATPPRGLVPALNLALERSRGEFVARQDADDASHPERLALQVEAMRRHPDWDVVGTLVRLFPDPPPGMRRYAAWLNSLVRPEEIRRDIWIESPLAHPTVLMRRSLLQRVGGYRDMGWPEDYDLWLRLHRMGCILAKVPEILYAWRDDARRLSRTSPVYSEDAFRRCKAHHLARVLEGRPVWIWGAGPFGRRLARALREEGVVVERFLDIDPLKIGRRVQGAPVDDVGLLGRHRPGEALLLVCVGQPGARDLIRRQLQGWGYEESGDYLVVA